MSVSILLIYTGGTIGMIKDQETGLLKPFDFEHLLSQIPELKQFNYKIDTHSFQNPVDSSNAQPATWLKLARLILDNRNNYDGFVVLHGSDTMAFSASALSFLLRGFGKPVILTGSQLPVGVIRTDGKENLITSIEIAAARRGGVPIVPEVAVYFEYQLYRGNRTSKVSAAHFDAFMSPNFPVLAEAGLEIEYNWDDMLEVEEENIVLPDTLNSNVSTLKIFPGMTSAYTQAVLTQSNAEVVILETFGAGNIPTNPELQNQLRNACDSDIHLINVTQCLRGSVQQGSYETSSFLAQIGVLSGGDMTFEAALTKSMYLLTVDRDNFKTKFLENICGERT